MWHECARQTDRQTDDEVKACPLLSERMLLVVMLRRGFVWGSSWSTHKTQRVPLHPREGANWVIDWGARNPLLWSHVHFSPRHRARMSRYVAAWTCSSTGFIWGSALAVWAGTRWARPFPTLHPASADKRIDSFKNPSLQTTQLQGNYTSERAGLLRSFACAPWMGCPTRTKRAEKGVC